MVIANITQLGPEETHQITLEVPSTSNATKLQGFTEKVKQAFAVRSFQTVGYWDKTVITFETYKTTTLTDIYNRLLDMPEVQKAEQKWTENRKELYNGILVILTA